MRKPHRSTLTLLLTGVAAVSLAAAVAAQPRHGRLGAGGAMPERFFEHRFERLAEYLELSQAQRLEAEALHDRWHGEARERHETLRASAEALHEMVSGENPDATAVGELVIQLHRAHEATKQAHEGFRAELAALLTPEQVEKLEAWEAARPRGEGFGRHHGHGGPHRYPFHAPDAH